MSVKERVGLSLRAVCFALLLTAAVFRLLSDMNWAEVSDRLRNFGKKPATEVAVAQPTEPPQPLAVQAMAYFPPTQLAIAYTAADADLVGLKNRAGASFDPKELICAPTPVDFSQPGPKVLIVHSHTTEAYLDTYTAIGSYHTDDGAYSVVRVGQTLCDALNSYGIAAVHDTAIYDEPDYDAAYENAAQGIAAYLEQYPTIQMVIDVHRDSVQLSDGAELALHTTLNGEDAAKLLLVMGTDYSGLEHPNWRGNLSFALKLQALCERDAAGLFRDITLRSDRYNEHLTPYSILLEVGSAGNTLAQAQTSAEFFARELALLLYSCDS